MALKETSAFPQFAECLQWCYSLQSENKRTRKVALVEFEKLLKSGKNELSKEDYHELFRQCHIILFNTLRDASEQVREQSIKFMHTFLLDLLPLNDYYLSYLFPILLERIGTSELVEDSEDLRLQLVQFLYEILSRYKEPQLRSCVYDSIIILRQTVQDKFPAVKEISCKCIVKLAQTVPQMFHKQAINLVKPVLKTFAHQRYRIRVEAIKCMGEIVMNSDCKSIEESFRPMAERLFDLIPMVRETVIQVIARWMLQYRDRYSFYHKLLPLILTGLQDTVQKNREEAERCWVTIGQQYQKENEKDLKDQMDYLVALPKYYPSEVTRPTLGCRVLVQRNVSNITGALVRELSSWQADVRVRCSQLLCAIALHAEETITQHLQELLVGMYSAARDDDRRVVANIVKACEIMACFVPVANWMQLITPVVEENPHYGHLMILAAFVRAAPKEHVTPCLLKIVRALSDPCISYSRKMHYQRELINCVQALESKYTSEISDEFGQCLFEIIVTMISIRDSDNKHISDGLLIELQETLGFSNQYELWNKFVKELLLDIKDEPKSWSATTIERCVFETILLKSKETFGENLEIIGDILAEALGISVDPEARLKTFIALSNALDMKAIIFQRAKHIDKFLKLIITEICVPSLIWHAGRTNEAMRTVVATCLLSTLSPDVGVDIFKTQEFLRLAFDEVLPLLISLAKDTSHRSRKLALEIMVLFKAHLLTKNNWEVNDLVRIYPEMLYRLDDPIDQVRLCAIKSIRMILIDIPGEFLKSVYHGHHEHLIDTLFTHFDDNEDNFRDSVFDCIRVTIDINGPLLKARAAAHKPILRNKAGCDKVLKLFH